MAEWTPFPDKHSAFDEIGPNPGTDMELTRTRRKRLIHVNSDLGCHYFGIMYIRKRGSDGYSCLTRQSPRVDNLGFSVAI